MRVTHFYHCYAAGDWQLAVSEHLDALEESGFDGRFVLGLVGSASERAEAYRAIAERRRPDRIVEAERAWEQLTLHAVRRHAIRAKGVVLYAHTKGAAHPTRDGTFAALRADIEGRNRPGSNDHAARIRQLEERRRPKIDVGLGSFEERGMMSQQRWREIMTDHVIRRWRDWLGLLKTDTEVVGMYRTPHKNAFLGNF